MNPSSRKPPLGLATGIALAIAVAGSVAIGQQESTATAADRPDPATQVAESMPRADRSLLLAITDAADRAIAVGERGHILVSESRSDWRQVKGVPTRATLTSVTAVGNKVWAVGHDGVILHSPDAGLTWVRQRAAPFDPDVDDPQNGAPLLDVFFLDQENGFALGAYALLLRTADAGATWNPVPVSAPVEEELQIEDDEVAGEDESWVMSEEDTLIEEESDPHLNAMARTGDGSLLIVAERGAAFRSTDGGATWQRLSLPYDGSMFGVIGYEGQHLLAFGLRGTVLETFDLGETWTQLDTGTDLSLMGGVGWGDGGAALVGANGVVLTRAAAGGNLLRHTHPDAAVLSSVLALAPNGMLVLVGENGVMSWTPN